MCAQRINLIWTVDRCLNSLTGSEMIEIALWLHDVTSTCSGVQGHQTGYMCNVGQGKAGGCRLQGDNTQLCLQLCILHLVLVQLSLPFLRSINGLGKQPLSCRVPIFQLSRSV